MEFSPDGHSVFGVLSDGDAFNVNSYFGQVWHVGREVSPILERTPTGHFLPSADRLLTATESSLLLRDIATGRVLGAALLGEELKSEFAYLAPEDGRTVRSVGPDNTVRTWQLSADAEPLSDDGADRRARSRRIRRQTRGLHAFWTNVRADGRVAASMAKGVADRECVRLTDPRDARSLGPPLAHQSGWIIGSLAFSPDGRSLATGSNPDGRVAGEVRLWDLPTGGLRFPPILHTNYVRALAFHPDGRVLAAGDFNGLVRFWDTSTGREIGRPLSQGEIVLSLAYSPDGKVLAVGLARDRTGKPGARLWDTKTRQPLAELLRSTNSILQLGFQPHGRALLASSNDDTWLWDTVRARAIAEPLRGETIGGFRPDGQTFLTLGRDGSVKLRDATTGGSLATLLTSSSAATCGAFRDDGGLIAAGFDDGTVRLCDAATNQPIGPARWMRHSVRHVTFPPGGRSVAAVDEFGEIRTWPIPEPLGDRSFEDLTLRIEARTGLRMDAGLSISRLSSGAWSDRLNQLDHLDSPAARPETDPSWHAPRILEAEQAGNTFAALWHLDRLIAARPNDWLLYARRTRVRSLSGEFAKASDDFRQAERLGETEQVLDFQTQCVLDCTRAECWSAALWYLDRLIAIRPDDGRLHEDRAAVCAKLGREADRQSELARVFELGADEGLVVPRAEVLARAGRWTEAASLLARCGRKGPVSRELAQAWAIACVKARDSDGYREACTAFLAQEGPDPTVVWNALSAASLLTLAPGANANARALIASFEHRLTATPPPPALYRHLFSSTLGALLVRAGRHDEAIARITEGIAAAKAIELPTDWCFLALADARRGKWDEARESLEQVPRGPAVSSLTFWEIQEVELLRSEAESLLGDAGFPHDPFQSPERR
jgi:WD40 repeat protein/tetratricopeptide (TPR) repeat protein